MYELCASRRLFGTRTIACLSCAQSNELESVFDLEKEIIRPKVLHSLIWTSPTEFKMQTDKLV